MSYLVHVFHDPGFSGSRFFQVSQGSGLGPGPGFWMSPCFSSSDSRISVQFLEEANQVHMLFKKYEV